VVDSPGVDLDDPQQQETILSADPVTVKLSFDEVKLYRPSVAMRRDLYGFISDVYSEVSTQPRLMRMQLFLSSLTDESEREQGIAMYNAAIANGLAITLNRNKEFRRDLYILCSKLRGKPGQIGKQQAEELGNELAEQATPEDTVALYAQLLVLAGLGGAVNARPPRRHRAA